MVRLPVPKNGAVINVRRKFAVLWICGRPLCVLASLTLFCAT